MLPRIASLTLAFALTLGLTETALAWCQSCTVEAPAGGTCAQTCFCPVDTNPAAHFLFWDRACMELSVMDRPGPGFTTAELDTAVDAAFAQWTDLDCGDGRQPGFQIRRTDERGVCDVAQYVSGEGNANTVAVVDDGWEERSGHDRAAFALTTTFFLLDTGEIVDADLELNEDDWDFATCPEEGCMDGSVDLGNTLTHEAGHFFGLAHSDADPESTMWACADSGETFKRSLAPDDVEGMCTVYGPDALSTECRFTPRGGFDPFCADDREGCGCRVAGTGNETPWAALFLFGVVLGWRVSRRGARG